MAMPVSQEEVERVLRPWLGSLFLSSNDLTDQLTERLSHYAPYRQSLDSLRDEDIIKIAKQSSVLGSI